MEGAFQGILPNQRQWEQEWPEVLQLKEKTNKGIKEKLTRSREEDEDVRKVTCEEYQDRTALLDLIKACGKHKDLRKGSRTHAEILEKGLLQNDITIGNALLSMYVKCGALAKAEEMFEQIPARNAVTWNALISGYAQHGLGVEAMRCFEQMRDEGIFPDRVTFICILKACGSIGAAEKGEQIHANVGRQGLLEKDIVLGTALVDMYAKCGAVSRAREIFNQLPARNVISWNALIAGYVQHGLGDEALSCFGQMQEEGLSPNASTFISILKACSSIGADEKGEEIHAEVGRQGLLEKDIMLGTTLVDMYAKCGALAKAQGVFDNLPARDAVTWNALITGYAQHGLGDEAVNCFVQMGDEGLFPNAITFTSILKACGSIGAAEKGEEIHAKVGRWGLLDKDIVLGNALVDMYAKCGVLVKAQEVFDKLPTRDVVTWNALLAGYAQVGKIETVFDSFIKMIRECTEPDEITFIVLLTACSHAGLVEEGQEYFDTMSTVHCITPTLEHCTCMVDIFSRAGLFDKAISVIEKVLPSDCLLLLSALMGSCRKWVNVEIGRWAFEYARQLDERFAAVYVCMSNIYVAAGMQEEADEVEALRNKNGAWKNIPGCCWWTDISRNVHSFTAGLKVHSQSTHIYAKLKDIAEKLPLEGDSPRLHWVPQAIPDNGKEDMLCGHNERLAIACALINTPEGTSIRITKNMRVCLDCHFTTSLISKMEKRKIQVIDANCIHIFDDGKCVCEEY